MLLGSAIPLRPSSSMLMRPMTLEPEMQPLVSLLVIALGTVVSTQGDTDVIVNKLQRPEGDLLALDFRFRELKLGCWIMTLSMFILFVDRLIGQYMGSSLG
ncbi:hypothetical protein V6N11_031042 [Hibiscus sabdariffa]|uniref:Uncharacterized protein n=1 Tax=Hibiscus sabdariffa TaxID=183260 RepID=A0ABR2ACB9_9ROSI